MQKFQLLGKYQAHFASNDAYLALSMSKILGRRFSDCINLHMSDNLTRTLQKIAA